MKGEVLTSTRPLGFSGGEIAQFLVLQNASLELDTVVVAALDDAKYHLDNPLAASVGEGKVAVLARLASIPRNRFAPMPATNATAGELERVNERLTLLLDL